MSSVKKSTICSPYLKIHLKTGYGRTFVLSVNPWDWYGAESDPYRATSYGLWSARMSGSVRFSNIVNTNMAYAQIWISRMWLNHFLLSGLLAERCGGESCCQIWILRKGAVFICFKNMSSNLAQLSTVCESGSGWIWNFFLDPDPELFVLDPDEIQIKTYRRSRYINNQNFKLLFCFNCTENTVELECSFKVFTVGWLHFLFPGFVSRSGTLKNSELDPDLE